MILPATNAERQETTDHDADISNMLFIKPPPHPDRIRSRPPIIGSERRSRFHEETEEQHEIHDIPLWRFSVSLPPGLQVVLLPHCIVQAREEAVFSISLVT